MGFSKNPNIRGTPGEINKKRLGTLDRNAVIVDVNMVSLD
jgi:hypothetical protein